MAPISVFDIEKPTRLDRTLVLRQVVMIRLPDGRATRWRDDGDANQMEQGYSI